MFPTISSLEIQDPIISSETEESESNFFYTPTVRQSQIASVNLNGFGSISEDRFGEVVPSINALHWSIDQTNCDVRPRLLDKSTGVYRLLDTGSQISTTSRLPSDKEDSTHKLIAVNGSRIKTYGKRDIEFKINRKTYKMPAIVCDVGQDILGMDFFHKFKMGLEWDEFDQSELYLTDKRAQIRTLLQVVTVPTDLTRTATLQGNSPQSQWRKARVAAQEVAFQVACVKDLDKSESKVKVEEALKLHGEKYVKMINY